MSTDMLAALTKARAALQALDESGDAVIGSAASIDAIDELCRLGSRDALDAQVTSRQLLLPVRLRDALDWRGKVANKPSLRTAAAALVEVRPDGVERYPVAVEALSYAAACAPMLQPDKLDELLAHCSRATHAWAPVTTVAKLHTELRRAIGHYSTARQFELMLSLWDAAHDPDTPRWWDACGGRGQPDQRGGQAAFEERAAQLQADAGLEVAFTPDEEGQAPRPSGNVLDRLLRGELVLTADAVAQLSRTRAMRQPEAKRRGLLEWARLEHPDADVPVLCALIPDLPPHSRPANPLGRMVEALLMAWTGEDGRLLVDQMPDKPGSWSELFPTAAVTGYAIAPQILELDGRRIDPPAGVPGPAMVVALIRNDNELQDNRTYMGNCTYAYRSSCQQGSRVIAKLHHGRETYNVAFDHTGGGAWRMGEINGYQNQRNRVPDWVHEWARQQAAQWRCHPPTRTEQPG